MNEEWREDGNVLPFFEGIETTTWQFKDGSKLELEADPEGHYFLDGYIGEVAFHDKDGEPLHFPNTDSLLEFLQKHGLLKLLSK